MKEIKITILSRDDCQFCDMAKSLFNRLKEEFELNIEVKDVDTPEGKEQIIKYGFLFLPGILINDNPFSYGRPSEKKIRKELLRLTSTEWSTRQNRNK